MNLQKEIQKRRTFAIISHPDAGKTTLTEKLLLYGGAINLAGTVKAKRSKKFATSDWMELEKQRGISITSSVMNFQYKDHEINLIDTPGHRDFSEDTYRTLTAVDSALMLIDCGNGVESQTKKLFEVCSSRNTPIMAFINKMDRDGREPFDLLEEIETVLGIQTYPVTWPIGMGPDFFGVYHRENKQILIYEKDSDRSKMVPLRGFKLEDYSELAKIIGKELWEKLLEEIELLEGAGNSFDKDAYLAGKLAPVFFGSALNSFGVNNLLDFLTQTAPGPLPRPASERVVDPYEDKFSAVVFKIQANMDPSHRDRVAFIRICSGHFERGMKAFHVGHKRLMRLGRPTQFMAQDRSLVDLAYAGDIVGIHDPGVFKIGDSLTEGEIIHFTGVPVFAPEYFYRVVLKDPMKSKQLYKALNQLSEEGALQVFRPLHSNDQYLGVVGELQIEVATYRIQAEYGVNVSMSALTYTAARWISSKDPLKLKAFLDEQGSAVCKDRHDQYTLLMDYEWRLKFLKDRHPDIDFVSTSESHNEDA